MSNAAVRMVVRSTSMRRRFGPLLRRALSTAPPKSACGDAHMKHDVAPEIEKTEAQWREELGPERYHILREAGTERPYTGNLLEERGEGTFHCGACGAALFK